MRKYLVVVRAGDGSFHESWLQGNEERNWDLFVSYFGNDEHKFKNNSELRIDLAGPKFPAIYDIFVKNWNMIYNYEYVMFPDDDVVSNVGDVNKYFEICSQFKLDLSQPSLDGNSYFTHPVTIKNYNFILRRTNFVEIMLPCFSRDFLLKCRETFGENVSGWGLDYLWPTMGSSGTRIGIVDAVSVHHARPVGGPMHGLFKKIGVDPREEERLLRVKYGVAGNLCVSTGGIDWQGKGYSIDNSTHGEFMTKLIRGYLPLAGKEGFDFMSIIEPNLRNLPPCQLKMTPGG